MYRYCMEKNDGGLKDKQKKKDRNDEERVKIEGIFGVSFFLRNFHQRSSHRRDDRRSRQTQLMSWGKPRGG
jgi:hypothetical protein